MDADGVEDNGLGTVKGRHGGASQCSRGSDRERPVRNIGTILACGCAGGSHMEFDYDNPRRRAARQVWTAQASVRNPACLNPACRNPAWATPMCVPNRPNRPNRVMRHAPAAR